LGHSCKKKSLQSALDTAFNKGINSTPVKALFGYQVKPMAEVKLLNSLQDTIDRVALEELRECIIADDQRQQKERYDKIRPEAERYQT
jgi:hypothetical protein